MLIRILAAAATAGDEAHDRPRYTAGRRPGALLSLFFFCLFFFFVIYAHSGSVA